MIDLAGNWGLLKTHISYAAVDTNDNVALKPTRYSHFWLKRIIATSYVGFFKRNGKPANQRILYWAPRKITNSQKSYGYKKAAQEAAGRNKAIPTPV